MKQSICADDVTIIKGYRLGETLKQLATDVHQQLRIWKQRSATRGTLARLPAHQLDDIGITEVVRQIELNKSFWEI
jgi:uncharacterized protein YjiS (DUF1127 family)